MLTAETVIENGKKLHISRDELKRNPKNKWVIFDQLIKKILVRADSRTIDECFRRHDIGYSIHYDIYEYEAPSGQP